MKYIISLKQYKVIVEEDSDKIETQFDVVKRFLSILKPKLPSWAKGVEVKKPRFEDQVVIVLNIIERPKSFEIEETLDKLWKKIYDYTNIPVAVTYKVENEGVTI